MTAIDRFAIGFPGQPQSLDGYLSQNAQANADLMAAMLADGGTFFMLVPGTYPVSYWPAGLPINCTLYLGRGVVLWDGGAGIAGPIQLDGGLWPNGKTAADAATTNSQPTVTSANINFTQADVGKGIMVRRTDGTAGFFRSVIISVAGNVATCSGNATFTASGCAIAVASNCGAALEALLAAYDDLKLPKGILYAQSQSGILTVRDGCSIEGEGWNFPSEHLFPDKGTVLLLSHSFGAASGLDIGQTATFGSGRGAASVKNLAIDGFGYLSNALRLINWNASADNCFVQGGAASQIVMAGVGAYCRNNSIFARLTASDAIYCNSTDAEISGNFVRGIGTGRWAITLDHPGGCRILNNHTFNSDTVACGQIRVSAINGETQTSVLIADNEFEVGLGHQIFLRASGSGSKLRNVTLKGNILYHSGPITDNIYDAINVKADATCSIDGVSGGGNTAYSAVNNYRSIWGDEGAVPATGVTLNGNVANGCKNVIRAGGPAVESSAGNLVADASARTTWSST